MARTKTTPQKLGKQDRKETKILMTHNYANLAKQRRNYIDNVLTKWKEIPDINILCDKEKRQQESMSLQCPIEEGDKQKRTEKEHKCPTCAKRERSAQNKMGERKS